MQAPHLALPSELRLRTFILADKSSSTANILDNKFEEIRFIVIILAGISEVGWFTRGPLTLQLSNSGGENKYNNTHSGDYQEIIVKVSWDSQWTESWGPHSKVSCERRREGEYWSVMTSVSQWASQLGQWECHLPLPGLSWRLPAISVRPELLIKIQTSNGRWRPGQVGSQPMVGSRWSSTCVSHVRILSVSWRPRPMTSQKGERARVILFFPESRAFKLILFTITALWTGVTFSNVRCVVWSSSGFCSLRPVAAAGWQQSNRSVLF